MIIGITGGIGSGKSTLSACIRNAGYPVYDTDSAARKLQNQDQDLKEGITALFGTESYINGELNRKYIASIVFENSQLLKKLNGLVHPAVRKDFKEWVQANKKSPLLFLECAILFEGDFHLFTDKVIVVTAPADLRVSRVMNRDNVTEQQVRARIDNQKADEDIISKADIVINTAETDIRKMDIGSFLQNLLTAKPE